MQKSPQIIDGHGFLCGFEKENAFKYIFKMGEPMMQEQLRDFTD